MKKTVCQCGEKHISPVKEIITGAGALDEIVRVIASYNAGKAYLVSDVNTYKAAGERVCRILEECGIDYIAHIFDNDNLHCDENAIGSAFLHYELSCDIIIGIGSGTVNDTCKILSNITKRPYIIVCTAPSMDGYASSTSSVTRDNLKISLNSKCADVIIGDIDILKNAPLDMLRAGLGDMIAKYISICEWRIGHLVTGEYYCEKIAKLVRNSLNKCIENAAGIVIRDEKAVQAVFDGLITSGLAMAYAGVSRPASGIEHYFSHIWDMRGVQFGTKTHLHGIQCAIGTLYAARLYEEIKKIIPDKNKAMQHAANFNAEVHREHLRDFLGKSADAMIELDEKEQKYNPVKHSKRLDVITNNWGEIIKIIDEEIPSVSRIEEILDMADIPKTVLDIGIDAQILPDTFILTMDIRDKYILSRLAWDLGVESYILNFL